MYVSKRTAVALLTASALAGSASTAVTALAHQRDHGRGPAHRAHANLTVLSSSIAPSVPAPTDPPLLGATPGSVPWVLSSGRAVLRSSGRLSVRIRGLLIGSGPLAGTVGPVKTVSASVYCSASSTPVGTSDSVPLSSDGDARITTTVTLPSPCLIPAVLIHPNGVLTTYIAANGFSG
jgi:hypothetical protein